MVRREKLPSSLGSRPGQPRNAPESSKRLSQTTPRALAPPLSRCGHPHGQKQRQQRICAAVDRASGVGQLRQLLKKLPCRSAQEQKVARQGQKPQRLPTALLAYPTNPAVAGRLAELAKAEVER